MLFNIVDRNGNTVEQYSTYREAKNNKSAEQEIVEAKQSLRNLIPFILGDTPITKLSEAIGVAYKNVHSMVKASHLDNFSLKTLDAVATFLKVNVEDLYAREYYNIDLFEYGEDNEYIEEGEDHRIADHIRTLEEAQEFIKNARVNPYEETETCSFIATPEIEENPFISYENNFPDYQIDLPAKFYR